MSIVNVEICHVDQPPSSPELASLIEATATTEQNEFPGGAVLVATVDGKPAAGVAIGKHPKTSRVCEIRNIQIPKSVDDINLVSKGLEQIARVIKDKAQLLYDGVLADEVELPNEFPKEIVLKDLGFTTVGFAFTSEEIRNAVR